MGPAHRLDAGRASAETLLAAAADGSLQVLFGTHALLEETVAFKRLTLAIVDEQHRFGVNQRLGLRGKGAAADLLVMTATPIPRSLALTLYGDLDTSYLRERPQARPPVKTSLVKTAQRDRSLRARPRRGQGRSAGLRRLRARRRVRRRRGARCDARVRAAAHEGLLRTCASACSPVA